jgi:ribosomal-protein-alanine N-acetyltransferase
MALPHFEAVHTARLTIRPVQASDLPDLLAVNGDDAVTHFLPYASWASLDDGTAWLARMHAMAATGTGTQLVIERQSDGRVLGGVLLFNFNEGSARIELGYVLGRAHWRQGLAREAITAVCKQAFGPLGIRRIEAEVNPDNHASNNLLQRIGFAHEGRARQRWVAKGKTYDTNLYGCLAGEWGRMAS